MYNGGDARRSEQVKSGRRHDAAEGNTSLSKNNSANVPEGPEMLI